MLWCKISHLSISRDANVISPVRNMQNRRTVLLAIFTTVVLLGGATHAEPNDSNNKLTEAARENSSRLNFDGDVFTGPALGQLLTAARNSQFFLIGEEHGIAENPKLVAQLFTTLVADGYEKLVIEVSPPVAADLDTAAKDDGINGLRRLFASPGGEPAFFGMREEAELLAAVRAALPDTADAFWGVDYEVASDRPLLRQLSDMDRPASSDQPLETLIAASDAAWSQYYETGSPEYIFSFSGDPALVTALSDAWPDPNDKAAWILDTLRSTMEINRLWIEGRGWESNARRAALMRSNFLRHWQAAKRDGKTPKVIAKLGSNHMVRGRNMTGTFDLGTLLPEIAATEGSRSFSLLVLPGIESLTAVLNASSWSRYESRPAKDGYSKGLEALTDAAYADAFTLIDLAALRPVVGSSIDKYGAGVARVVHGYDVLLVMSGSTASSELQHD
jgi:hypothetical protein